VQFRSLDQRSEAGPIDRTVVVAGDRNAPCSSRFQYNTGPELSQTKIFTRSVRFERNTKTVPENGSFSERLAHQGDKPIGTFDRPAASPPAPAFPPEPQSCGRLHSAQHISEPAKVNADYRPRDLIAIDPARCLHAPAAPGAPVAVTTGEGPDGQSAPLCATQTDSAV
jgi:hypothetical protein